MEASRDRSPRGVSLRRFLLEINNLTPKQGQGHLKVYLKYLREVLKICERARRASAARVYTYRKKGGGTLTLSLNAKNEENLK